MSETYTKGPIELRLGDYRDVLADVEPDAVITDPPYSERTHAGQRSGSRPRGGDGPKTNITYEALGDGARVLADFWAPRTAWWAVVFSDHVGSRDHEAAWASAGWYVFAPVGYVRLLPTPRLSGDGPTSAIEYLTVARPRHRIPAERCGSRPGYYLVPDSQHGSPQPGGKHLAVMRALVRDYSRPGDLVCDPCAGGATTLIAAALEGRRAIGAELDPETYAKACARIERTALTAPLPGLGEPRRRPEQQDLLGFATEPC